MTLNAGLEMRKSASFKGRVESAAYDRDQTTQWVDKHYPKLIGRADWRAKWAAAPLYNPDGSESDTGARDDVISDEDIAAAVEALIGEQEQTATAEQTAQDQRIAELEAKVADLQKVIDRATPAESEADAS